MANAWSIKRRVKRLRHGIIRLRHFRGHGIHSPYLYKVFREVFMDKTPLRAENPMISILTSFDLPTSKMRELGNLAKHNGWSAIVANSDAQADVAICTCYCPEAMLKMILSSSAERGTPVIFIEPHKSSKFENRVGAALARHNSCSVDRYNYLLLLNNHLPKQHFRL
ncbi:MAG: hypothetical protein SNH88_05320 [Rikenellaceae bacterium]